jgi:hypothetical protein
MDHITKQKNTNLDWVIGFAEGNGSFGVYEANTGDVLGQEFVIIQKDPKVLYKVKKYLGFGKVEPHGEYYRYIVRDIRGTHKIIEIMNGNLCLEKVHKRFSLYVQAFNKRIELKRYKSLDCPFSMQVLEKKPIIFNTGWFSGIIDAEGCFCTVLTDKTQCRTLRFIIDQKDEFMFLRDIQFFMKGGSICEISSDSNYRYQYELIRSDNEEILVRYLNQFPLQSQKSIDYIRWKKLRYRFLDGKHRDGRSLKRLQRLVSSLQKL